MNSKDVVRVCTLIRVLRPVLSLTSPVGHTGSTLSFYYPYLVERNPRSFRILSGWPSGPLLPVYIAPEIRPQSARRVLASTGSVASPAVLASLVRETVEEKGKLLPA